MTKFTLECNYVFSVSSLDFPISFLVSDLPFQLPRSSQTATNLLSESYLKHQDFIPE